MNLQELGAVFKQERERRGLSVEDVVQRTKISRRNLLAIEAGRKEDLPHPVYAKGFVKNYARLLDLDPEAFAAALSQEYFVAEDDFGNDPTRDKPISMTATRSVGSQNRHSSMRGVLLFLLAAAVGGVILWSMLLAPRQHPAPPSLPVPQAAPAAPAEPEPAPLPQEPLPVPESPAAGGVYVPPSDIPPTDATPAPEAKKPAAPAKPSPEAAAPKLAPAEAPAPKPAPKPAPEPPAPKPAAEAPALKPAVEAPAAKPLPTTGTRVMDIRANQLCWINAEVDGTTVLDMVLQPGETKYIHFDKALTVKFGNAGGVKVTLDNKPFPLNAQSGEVRTLTIP